MYMYIFIYMYTYTFIYMHIYIRMYIEIYVHIFELDMHMCEHILDSPYLKGVGGSPSPQGKGGRTFPGIYVYICVSPPLP